MLDKLKIEYNNEITDEFNESEIHYFYSFFLDKCRETFIKKFNLSYSHINLVDKINKINNDSFRRKIYFENYSNEYYEFVDDQIGIFYKNLKNYPNDKKNNWYTLIDGINYDTNFIDLFTNKTSLIFCVINNKDKIETFCEQVIAILNDIFIEVEQIIKDIFNKNWNVKMPIEKLFKNYKKFYKRDEFLILFTGFKNNLIRKIKAYKSIVLYPSFFNSLDKEIKSLFNYTKTQSEFLKRYDFIIYNQESHRIHDIFSFYESNKSNERDIVYVELKLNNIFNYFFKY